MTSQDKARLAEWNLTDVEFESDKCVHDLIEAQAFLTPGKTAVICRDRSLTYRDLWEKARRLAIHLRGLGVGPETIVAIMMDRSLDMMVALIGVLKAGGAYLPLDPAFPAERIAFMLKDSDARVALTHSSYRNRLAESPATVIALDDFDFDDERTYSREMPTNIQPASSLAYLIYTSGSTGTPKGVMVEHRNVISFFAGMDRVIGVEQGVWLAVTSISFDISVLELLWTLSRGFTVVLQTGKNGLAATGDYSIAAQIARHRVTHFQCTPTLARSLMRFPETVSAMQALRKVLLGGEALPLSFANWLRKAIGAEIFNMYGPTETTVWSTTHKLVGTAGSVPIGKPIANTRTYIVDEQGMLAPIGAAGELYIGGAGVTRGYFRRPELTAERFIANSFHPELDDKLYRTGDLARYRDDGEIEFIGRTDQQVKIRGFRIELGEIETVLGAHPAVQEVLVAAYRDRADNLQLAAYVVPKPNVSVSPQELKLHARNELPEYMIPAVVNFLSAMPLTPNGKTDRKALSSHSPDAAAESAKGGYASTEMERIIAELWQDSLALDAVGLQFNLFDLGANSLSVAEVAMSLRQRLKREIPLTDFFAYPTIAALAAHLSGGNDRSGDSKDLVDHGAARRQALLARSRAASASASEASK
ncbi:non-ribosomal peptide synthetase [Candidatus Binatus sp.]|uniref:non-ribosomal peptide synthetase n=1 Tax=Candidatus Binatus sp. TaxID=2811406 RepID=UPI003CC6B83C